MAALRWAFEDTEKPLAVSRLAEAERQAKQGDVYDNLYDEIHQQAEAEKKADEAKEEEMPEEDDVGMNEAETEEPEAEDTDDTDESADGEDDKAEPEETSNDEKADPDTAPQKKETDEKSADDKADSKEADSKGNEDDAESKDTQKALESLSLGMESLSISLLKLGDEFEPHLLTGVNNGIYLEDYAPNLARIGFKYGKLLLHHVYKGVAVILDTAVKGLYKSNRLFVKTVRNAIQSYERQQKALEDLEKAVEGLSELKGMDGSRQPEGEYRVASVIQALKVGESVDMDANLQHAIDFTESYMASVGKAVKSHLYTTQRLIDTVIDQKLNVHAEKLMREQMLIPHFKQETIDGYEPKSEHITSYVYEEALPSDVKFIAWLPANSVLERSALIQAYQEAKFFFGVANQDIPLVEQVPYLTPEQIPSFLKKLHQLCELGLKQRQLGPEIARQRDGMKKSLLRYLGFLMTSKERISIEDSCAEYIALRSRSLDKTYLSGLLHVDEYQRRLISAGLRYAEASIKAYRAAAPAEDDTMDSE